ncbi:rCG61358, isoform CRA_d [Rattus norvegicus]|uniref:RCG61358, isoform CRA_d n=1 Tax=Rattus norvegicus TaxID=10116 RepID=A6HAX2_RAT|nr:rCG61358, isoform CRA_d [Rattus norvegicus]
MKANTIVRAPDIERPGLDNQELPVLAQYPQVL